MLTRSDRRPSRTAHACATGLVAAAAFLVNAGPVCAQVGAAGGQARSDVENRLLDRQKQAQRKTPRFLGLQMTDEPLEAVRVEGNTTIPEHAILSLVGTQAGRPAYQDQVAEDVRTLMNRRWFSDVKPLVRTSADTQQPVLVFRVVEKPVVGKVEFRGNKKFKTKKLLAETGLTPGRSPFDVNANKACVRRIERMYRDKGYRDVAVTLRSGSNPEDRDVVFEIIEGDKLQVDGFQFVGNRFVSAGVLKTKLQTSKSFLRLPIGGQYDPESLEGDEVALATYYRNLGFFDVEVKAEPLKARNSGSIKVRYTITEGPRYRVRSVKFLGNEVFGDGELRGPLVVRPGRYFLAREVQKDVQAIMDKYDATGRPYTKVDFKPDFTTTPGEFDLVYTIDEDIVRYIGKINIHIRGDDPHTRETVARNIVTRHVKPGELARAENIRRATTALRGSRFFDRADPAVVNVRPNDGRDYMAPSLARAQDGPDASAPEENTSFKFGHSVLPTAAPPANFGAGFAPPNAAPALRGGGVPRMQDVPLNRGTGRDDLDRSTRGWFDALRDPEQSDFAANPAATVRGQSTTYPVQTFGGGPYDPGLTGVRPQSIDAFGQPVPQSFIPGGSPQGDPYGGTLSGQPPGFVDLDIDLTEARTGRFMFGAGVNSDAGVVGQITLEENNFDLFRPPRSWADVRNGRAFRGGGQSFRLEAAPGAQVSRYLVSWQDPFFLNTDYSFGVSGFYYTRFFEDWTEERLGGRVSLGRLINQNWSFGTAIRLERVLVRDILDVPGNEAPQIIADAEGTNFLSTGRVALTYDDRDSSFIPTTGTFAEFSYEQAFGDFVYPRFDAALSRYWTTYQRPDGLGKHTLRLSGKFGYTGDDTPVFERYFAGGFQTFRGFDFRGVSPVEAGRRVGGQFMTLGTLEYMLPVTANDNFKVVGFTDFGTVDESVSLENFRISVGAGLRVNVPAMGPAPLAFDFAVPLTKQDFDDERVFSFYIGLTR